MTANGHRAAATRSSHANPPVELPRNGRRASNELSSHMYTRRNAVTRSPWQGALKNELFGTRR